MVLVRYHQGPFWTGTDRSVSSIRDLISSKSARVESGQMGMAASVYRFSASQVLDHLGVLAVAEPGIVVDPPVPMSLDDLSGGGAHAGELRGPSGRRAGRSDDVIADPSTTGGPSASGARSRRESTVPGGVHRPGGLRGMGVWPPALGPGVCYYLGRRNPTEAARGHPPRGPGRTSSMTSTELDLGRY